MNTASVWRTFSERLFWVEPQMFRVNIQWTLVNNRLPKRRFTVCKNVFYVFLTFKANSALECGLDVEHQCNVSNWQFSRLNCIVFSTSKRRRKEKRTWRGTYHFSSSSFRSPCTIPSGRPTDPSGFSTKLPLNKHLRFTAVFPNFNDGAWCYTRLFV